MMFLLKTKIILKTFISHILWVKPITQRLKKPTEFTFSVGYSERNIFIISAIFFVIFLCFSGVHMEIMYWRSRSKFGFVVFGDIYIKSLTVTCSTSAISASFWRLGFLIPLSILLIYAVEVFTWKARSSWVIPLSCRNFRILDPITI